MLSLNVIFKCPIITSFMSSINLSGLLSEKSTLCTYTVQMISCTLYSILL